MAQPKFYELFKQGLVDVDDIYDYIDEWHNTESKEELADYLGMTENELKVMLGIDEL